MSNSDYVSICTRYLGKYLGKIWLLPLPLPTRTEPNRTTQNQNPAQIGSLPRYIYIPIYAYRRYQKTLPFNPLSVIYPRYVRKYTLTLLYTSLVVEERVKNGNENHYKAKERDKTPASTTPPTIPSRAAVRKRDDEAALSFWSELPLPLPATDWFSPMI